jgi:hypothetical protein
MIDDAAAISALISRYVRALRLRDIEQQLIADANQRLSLHVSQLTDLRSAFAVFDFKFDGSNIWSKMRDQIGNEAYWGAVAKGKEAIESTVFTAYTKTGGADDYISTTSHRSVPAPPVDPIKPPTALMAPPEATEGADEIVATASNVLSQMETTSDDNGDQTTQQPAGPPRVRDAVLERLRLAGDKGLKAADLRQYYENAFSAKLHEKTVGMTLYRLSKEQLVRRDGRTWYYVAPVGGAQNQIGDSQMTN